MTEVDLGARALFALALLTAASTEGALLVFRRFSDRALMGRAANRILAHLMELGLFFDEPVLVLRAHRDLLRENLKLLRSIVVPCALLALPFVMFFAELDAVFSRAPLVVGAPAIVTLEWAGSTPVPVIISPPGIVVETPAVRSVFSHEVSWRIRPVQIVKGRLEVALAGRVLTATAVAGPGLLYAFPFPRSPLRIRYPHATILHLDWVFWYILGSIATAVAFSAC
ncbi:MAG: hypothetical protein ABSB35_03740 [Bryobacteraceae bacterium]